MFDYLQQFNKLPKEIRDKISEPTVMKEIDRLEGKYKVELAALIMKIMVKQVPLNNLALYLVGQFDLDGDRANKLSQELREKVFVLVGDHLKTPPKKEASGVVAARPVETASKPVVEEKKEAPKKSVSDNIDQVIKDAQVSLSSSQLSSRLKLVLNTYIRGVRDKVATRSVLGRSPQEGGLGLDQATVDKLFKLITQSQAQDNTVVKTEKPVSKVIKQADVQDKLESLVSDYSLEKSIKEKKLKEEAKIKELAKQPAAEVRKALAPPPPVVQKEVKPKIDLDKIEKKAPVAPKPELKPEEEKKTEIVKPKPEEKKAITEPEIKPVVEKKKEEEKMVVRDTIQPPKKSILKREKKVEKKKEPVEEKKEDSKTEKPLAQPSQIVGGKQRMDDIKPATRIMDPIDELRYLNLLNFRRLGDTPEEGINKIKEKLELLGKEAYEKKIAGIEGWRKNPLNQLYLEVTRESIDQGKPIKEVLAARKEANQDALTLAELQALVAFNREIMF